MESKTDKEAQKEAKAKEKQEQLEKETEANFAEKKQKGSSG